MEFYVDIADLQAVKKVAEYYTIEGFTTNPNILAISKQMPDILFKEYKSYIEQNNYKLFVQVTEEKAEDMLLQAQKLCEYFGKNLVVKLPATKEGYRAIKLCKEFGISVCLTVVHSSMQAIVAARAGADYVAPYITHIDNLGLNGVLCVEEMLKAIDVGGYDCKVLGASFRTVNQIKELAAIGCDAVTITPEMFDALIASPSTDESMEKFRKAWKNSFGDKQVDEFIPK